MWSSAIVASLHYLALAVGLPAIFLRGRALNSPWWKWGTSPSEADR